MSHQFIPVQWNRQKFIYDAVIVGALLVFMAGFLVSGLSAKAADPVILILRALGACALVLLHIILAIGPLARLSPRFKPLLYNRRHFGVITALIALAHAGLALVWYHGSGVINPLVSALGGYGDYGRALDIPFEGFGVLALIILLIMAATSHDFWLAWLSPPIWKTLHMSVYGAYILLVLHVGLGTAQFSTDLGLLIALSIGAVFLCGLHLMAAWQGTRLDRPTPHGAKAPKGWIYVGAVDDIDMNKALTLTPPQGQRIAIFRHAKGISAVVGVCAHQNGPLGEGCIIDGLITCPWHGFQFDPETGAAPAPFTDRVQTHQVKVEAGHIWVKDTPDPWDTPRQAVEV